MQVANQIQFRRYIAQRCITNNKNTHAKSLVSHRSSSPQLSKATKTDDIDTNLTLGEKERDTESLKTQLIRLTASSKNGKHCSVREKEQIIEIMDALEFIQRNQEKEERYIDGEFSLLFTSAKSAEEEKERERKEGKIGSFVTNATNSSGSSSSSKSFSFVDSVGNYQNISLDSEIVENRADVVLFGSYAISIRIFGTCERREGSSKTKPRFDVKFTHAKIESASKTKKRSSKVLLEIPLARINAKGWIDVTYADASLRLGVGDKGSRFVTVRKKKFDIPCVDDSSKD